MNKLTILSGLALFGAVSLASLHVKPALAGCGWGDITCNPKNWTCPPGGCLERPKAVSQLQVENVVIIQTLVNGRVFDFTSSSNNREPLILVNKHSGESQQWQLVKLYGTNKYLIRSMVNTRVLDFRNAQNNKEPVILVDYHGGDSQFWSLVQLPNGRYLIKSTVNGRVLDFRSAENNKEPVLLVDEHRGHSQQWVLVPVK